MKLLRLRVDGFGLLRGEWTFDPSRVTVVVDENERGKTSMLHAIAAALYGLEADGRRHRGLLTPLERWRPWDGGDFRVELTLERGGQRYVVIRDFGRGTVAVLNGRGEDLTPEFHDGKDEFSVGRKLLGLDFEEFAKCAFWRQGELDDVVPDLERERRVSTMHARLEEAVDSREGRGTAVDAIQVLDRSLQKYTSAETGATLTVENTVRRLEDKKHVLETEIDALEHDYRQAVEPLERLTRLAEVDAELRQLLALTDARRLRARAADAHARLERDAERRERLEQLEVEARGLEDCAGVPLDAEARLRELMGSFREKQLKVESTRRDLAQRGTERDQTARDLEPFANLATHTPADADRIAGASAALRSLIADDERLAEEIQRAGEALAAQGVSPERADLLLQRFERFAVEGHRVLSDQPRLALSHQAARAAAARMRYPAERTLQDVARWKRGWAIAGISMLVSGAGIAASAAAPQAAPLFTILVASGAAVAAIGLATLLVSAIGRRRVREEALQRIVEADDHIADITIRDEDNARKLNELARTAGVMDGQALLSDWAEYQRLRDLHAPVRSAHSQRAGVERQRGALVAGIAPLLAHVGGGEADADRLDDVATRIRARVELSRLRGEAEHRLREAELAARGAELDAQAAEQQAAAVIASAGLRYERGVSWSAWVDGVSARVRQAQRLVDLVDRAIPAEQHELLGEAKNAELRAEIAAAEALPADPEAPVEAMSAAQLDAEMARIRSALEDRSREREELRLAVDGVSRRYHAEHPARVAELESVEEDLARAQRFRAAVTMARDTLERVTEETHRRWAQFLDRRVTEILASVGSSIDRVRFGDDLDYRVTLRQGPDDTRGKALLQLSAGARDQLHLAVRLAISEYLSRGGEALPLLIDDCFATSDDERARTGMRLLLEAVARRHQVVLVTCHRERYRAFAARDHELYENHVRWLTLSREAIAES